MFPTSIMNASMQTCDIYNASRAGPIAAALFSLLRKSEK